MGSPFASLVVSDPIPLPFDGGQWIRVRKLTGRQHEEAQAAHRGAFASGRTNGWAVTFRRALEKGANDPDVLKALSDPLTGYDRYELVRLGLVAWSYDRPLTPVVTKVEGQPDQVSDAIEDLDDDAVDFIAREVLRLTKPGVFLSKDDSEAARKNG